MTDGQTETEGSLAYSELNRNAIRKLEQLGQPYTEKKQRYMICQKRHTDSNQYYHRFRD